MKKKPILTFSLFASFIVWTLLLRFVDVKAIGPKETSVGFSTLNGFVHNLTGTNMRLYTITDWLGLVPIFIALDFAILGLSQLIKRRNLLKVDRDILALGGFYIAVIMAYILFEFVVINYRPIIIDGYLEASYPSSTTMLVLCVMPTASMQINSRIRNLIVKRFASFVINSFAAFMVVARILSGVHWITDIIGGALLSSGLVMTYKYFSEVNK
ncbi:MAG: phosphatase PAP2 family protein [Ruminococcaceae bacterium]|nr:phosphatase PAP2 family protein [Oscillospiraceae bacterium]